MQTQPLQGLPSPGLSGYVRAMPSRTAGLSPQSMMAENVPWQSQRMDRADIRALLLAVVDVVVQLRRIDGRFRMTEVWYDPLGKRRSAT